MTTLVALALFVVAFPLWSLAEYVLHRFLMHEAKGRGLASREHLKHHAERDSILESWPLSWSGVVLVGVGLGFLTAGPVGVGPAGWALGGGWVAAYGAYDWIHWRAHRRPIANRYERFVRRHHFHHHFGHPLANHGVTTPIWDLVFGTYERVEGPIRVPRRLAMVWLVDEHGRVRPEHAADYELVGHRADDDHQLSEDRLRAFANLAPQA